MRNLLVLFASIALFASVDIFAQDSSGVCQLGYYRFWTPAQCVAVNGDYAYVGMVSGLQVVDISDPTQPRQAGFCSGDILNIAVDGDFAYVTNLDNVRILDISEPTQPQEVGSHNLDGRGEIIVDGDYAYCMGQDGLIIVDVSNPSEPSEAGRYETGDSAQAQGVAIVENCAYITYSYIYQNEGEKYRIDCIAVLDVSNPAEIQEVGLYETTETNFRGITVVGEYAFIATGDDGLWVMDVSDPTEPQELTFCDSPGFAYDIAIEGDYAYLPDGREGLWMVDISDPTDPQDINHCNTPGAAVDLAIIGNYVYVAGGLEGLRVVDISDPTEPHETGFLCTPYGARNLVVRGNNAYIFDNRSRLRVLDISDPSESRLLGSETHRNRGSDKTGIAINGDYAYVACGDFYVVDISGPETLETVGQCEIPDMAFDVAISGDYAFVASSDSGLSVVDISNPAEPHVVGQRTRPHEDNYFIAVEGDYAYVGDYLRGLRIINISDPTRPNQVGFHQLDFERYQELLDVDISGNHAFVLLIEFGDEFEDGNYLQIVDVSSPARPIQVGLYRIPGFANSVTVVGNYAYIAAGGAGLRVMDISDPTEMYEVGYYDALSSAFVVSVGEDGLVYIVERNSISTYDVSDALGVSSEFIFQPSLFMLNPAYPNPFNSTTTIRFNLPNPGPTRLEVYDLQGRKIRVLTTVGWMEAGNYCKV